ncbi:MAG: TonB family protein [Pseudomonadota bacterium]
MASKKVSAEIVEIDDARAKHRPGEVDPGNFPTVGAYLEAVRVASDLSADAVAERTHIKIQFIEAIDRMDLDALPAKPFAIGFVRSYAEAIGLAPEIIVDRFKSEAGFDEAPAPEEELEAPGRPSLDEATAGTALGTDRSHLTFLSVVAVLAFIIWCALAIARPKDPAAPVRLDGAPIANDYQGGQALMNPELGMNGPAEEAFSDRLRGDDAIAPPPLPRIVEGRVLERIEPVYSPRCETGAMPAETVALAFTIRVDGAVVSERVVESSNPCFNRSALNALRQWRFQPRTVDGVKKPAFDQQVVLTFNKPS